MNDNLLITKADNGSLTLHLTDYAAWAILRRLQGIAAADGTEAEFTDDVMRRLEAALTD